MKETQAIKLTDELYNKLHQKLINTIIYKKQLFQINKNLGSFQEPADYAQEVLICLNNKIDSGKVVFYNEPQLWTYCSRILNMLLLRQHRDYSSISSRKAVLIDIDTELESGKSLDDIIGFKAFDKNKSYEYKIEYESYKNYIIAINEKQKDVIILPITQLFSINNNYKLINLYNILEDVECLGIKKVFKKYNLFGEIKKLVVCKILSFLKINYNFTKNNNNYYAINCQLNSRDTDILKKLNLKYATNKKLSLTKLKSMVI